MSPAIPGLAAVLLYVLGTYTQIKRLLERTPVSEHRLLLTAVPAVVLHGICVYLVMTPAGGIDLGLFPVGALVAFVLTLFVLLASLRQPLHNLFLFVFPIGALAVTSALFLSSGYTLRSSLSAGFVAHILVSIFAYTVLTMAACQAVVLLVQERLLKGHQAIGVLKLLPPLETMESMLFQLLWTGIVLLTLSIASGFVFLEDIFARQAVHHIALSLTSWVIFAILLTGHNLFGWRGTTATRWTLVGFTLLVLAYFGTKFVLEILLDAN